MVNCPHKTHFVDSFDIDVYLSIRIFSDNNFVFMYNLQRHFDHHTLNLVYFCSILLCDVDKILTYSFQYGNFFKINHFDNYNDVL